MNPDIKGAALSTCATHLHPHLSVSLSAWEIEKPKEGQVHVAKLH